MSAIIPLQRLAKEPRMLTFLIFLDSFEAAACPPERLGAFQLQGDSARLACRRRVCEQRG